MNSVITVAKVRKAEKVPHKSTAHTQRDLQYLVATLKRRGCGVHGTHKKKSYQKPGSTCTSILHTHLF